jgi:blue copper oxidase
MAVGGSLIAAAACSRPLRAARLAVETPVLLPIPRLIDARRQGQSIGLTARSGQTIFFPGKSSATLGYNGDYLGPTLRVYRGDDVNVAVTNRLQDDTTVHWHGLLVAAELDGGPHQVIKPGATWRPTLPIRQPAATLFYHSHVEKFTGVQVYSGLAGILLVSDEEEQGLGLPSDYGVDDLPILIQDRQFSDGQLVVPQGGMTTVQGRRGDTILVNGAPNALARVPDRLVRLRLVNGSNARIYGLSFSDGRSFHWIGTDGGLLERSVELQTLTLAPGQRAEILVDFANGTQAALMSGPDVNTPMMGMMGGVRTGPRSPAARTDAATTILNFEPHPAAGAGVKRSVPTLLASRERPNPARAVRRRRLVLNMGMGDMMGGSGGALAINGKVFDINRIDERARLGDVEIWEVSGEMMNHPLHIHGVHFDVISRDGAPPSGLTLT